MRIFTFLFLLLAFPASAETELWVNVWGTHIDTSTDYNNDFNTILLKHDDYFAGTFVNSYDDRSWILGRRFKTWTPTNWSNISLQYGLIYGYDDDTGVPNWNEITPYVLPTIEIDPWENDRFGLKLFYLPNNGGGIVMTNLVFKF